MSRTGAPGAPRAAGSRFALLLYGGVEPAAGAADSRRQEYAAWARDLASRGVTITGEELGGETRAVGAATAAPAGGLPRGFFILTAENLDAAERIAATCPHIRYGGRVAVKRIVP